MANLARIAVMSNPMQNRIKSELCWLLAALALGIRAGDLANAPDHPEDVVKYRKAVQQPLYGTWMPVGGAVHNKSRTKAAATIS